MRRILPRPARFSPQEYTAFLKAYPHVEQALSDPFVDEDGEQIPLIRKNEADVFMYIGLFSAAQQDALGTAALRAIRKHLQKSPQKRLPVILVIMGAVIVIVAGGMVSGGFDLIKNRFLGEKPPQGNMTATPTPALVVKTSPTPTPKPTTPPTATPRRKPTAKPTAIPVPTATPTPTPEPGQPSPTLTLAPVPTATPTTAPIPTATPSPTSIPSIGKVILRDQDGFTIPEGESDTYWVKPHEKISINTKIAGNSSEAVNVEYSAIRGDIQPTGKTSATYIASDRPESKDVLTLKIIDVVTKKILDQHVCKIQTLKR